MVTDFTYLLTVLGEERLGAHLAGRRLLHVAAPQGFDPRSLLTLAEIETLVAEGQVPAESLSIFHAATAFDLAENGLVADGHVAPGARAAMTRDGATFILNHVERLVPRLRDLARDAGEALGEYVEVGAVGSSGCEPGLRPHYDSESLILIQLAGTKTWRFYGAPAAGSGRKPLSAWPVDLPVSAELEMHPGDLLFVPAGLRHQCKADGHSLHLGLLIGHQSGVLLAERLLHLARADAALNEPLFRTSDAAAVAAQAEAYKTRLRELLDELDPMAALDRRLAHRLGDLGREN